MLDLFNDVPAFVAAAEFGSFSAAGRRLGLSRSAVGKAVARLEARLAVRLFQRTTRALVLTEEGRGFLARCSRAVAELRGAGEQLEAGRGRMSGTLRVTMPALYGRLWVAPALLRLAAAHPELSLELDFRDRPVALVEEGFDLAVRSGALGNLAGLSSRTVGRHATALCAAPALLERLGTPAGLGELRRWPSLVYRRDGWVEPWVFPAEDGRFEVLERPSRLFLSDLSAILDAAVAGEGVAWLPDWLTGRELAAGRLCPVLPGQPAVRHDISLLWPASSAVPARVRAAVEAVAAAAGAVSCGDVPP